jgi:hypothetical protein
MATYFLQVRNFSRGRGARVTRAIAYRAGERIVDERTGEVCNFSDRTDVAHKEIVLPAQFDSLAEMNWARNRSALWNAAEFAGRQRNSRLAREVLVILPHELTPAQRTNLVRSFSQELVDKYRSAIDFAIHPPRPGSDERNHHAHIVMTTREVTPRGLGARTALDLSGTERHARGLGPSKADYFLIRERWAQLSDEALRHAGIDARIDHRSLVAQGVDREPQPNIPLKIYYAELKSGRSTPAGDAIRARHRERVEAHGTDELARVLLKHKEEDRQRAITWSRQREGRPKTIPRSALTRAERNQRERERRKLNSEQLNQKRRERYRANPEEVLQKLRAYRLANAERISEVRKQWYRANAQRLSLQRQTVRQQQPTAEEAARKWLKFRERQQEAPTAEDSARKWLEYRKQQTQEPTAEESARKWLEYSLDQKGLSQGGGEERPRNSGSGEIIDSDEDDRRKAGRSRDDDFGL